MLHLFPNVTLLKLDLWDTLSFFCDVFIMLSNLVKQWPFKVHFIFGNRKKSCGAMSGEYYVYMKSSVLY